MIVGQNLGLAPLSFTLVGYTRGGGSSLNFASLTGGTIAAGDFATYHEYTRDTTGSNINLVTPSGFTNLFNNLSSPIRMVTHGKILAGSEGTVTGNSLASIKDKFATVWRPSRPISGFTGGGNQVSIASTPSTITIDPTGFVGAMPLLLFAFGSSGGSTVNAFSGSMVTDAQVTITTASVERLVALVESAIASKTFSYDTNQTSDGVQGGYISFST